MKRCIVLALLSAMFLTGCFNIYQHVSLDRNGNADVYFQMTFSKALLEMSNQMGGESAELDYDAWLDETTGDPFDGLRKTVPIETGKINSFSEIGIFYRASLNYVDRAVQNLTGDDSSLFIPIVRDGRMTILAGFSDDDVSGSQENGMAAAFMGSAKYILTIDKNVMNRPSRAWAELDGEAIELPIVDLNDQYFIDIPIKLLLGRTVTISVE